MAFSLIELLYVFLLLVFKLATTRLKAFFVMFEY